MKKVIIILILIAIAGGAYFFLTKRPGAEEIKFGPENDLTESNVYVNKKFGYQFTVPAGFKIDHVHTALGNAALMIPSVALESLPAGDDEASLKARERAQKKLLLEKAPTWKETEGQGIKLVPENDQSTIWQIPPMVDVYVANRETPFDPEKYSATPQDLGDRILKKINVGGRDAGYRYDKKGNKITVSVPLSSDGKTYDGKEGNIMLITSWDGLMTEEEFGRFLHTFSFN